MSISLSDFLQIPKVLLDSEGCFDTLLDFDSRMFVNFIRIRDANIPELIGAYDAISKLFNQIGTLLSVSKKDEDRFWREAFELLKMTEFEEICLGYSENGTAGSGSGKELKIKILRSGKEIIDAGVKEPEIFEIVGLFEDDIGPDRISDFIARTISGYLHAYSIRVLTKIGIDNKSRKDIKFVDGLILNPFNGKKLYLLPKEILHELPVATEWEDISLICMLNEKVRSEINRQIGDDWKKMTTTAKKHAARRVVLQDSELIKSLIYEYREFSLDPYDFLLDPLGENSWYQAAKEITSRIPLKITKAKVSTRIELNILVLEICKMFKELIENNGLSEILYANGKPRRERIAQRLFYGIADAYCKANNTDINPETNSGRGAVDFKFSIGYVLRIVVEIKLTTNKQLLHGYTTQIGEYKKAEKTTNAIYLVIDNGGPSTRISELVALHNESLTSGITNCDLMLIDGNLKESASIYSIESET